MKKSIVYLLLSTVLFVGCREKFLDVTNINDLDESSFLTNEDDLKLAVNAAYCPLAHSGLCGLSWSLHLGTLDDRIWFESVRGEDLLVMNTSSGFSGGHCPFNECYRGIYRCSDIIKNLHNNMIPSAISEEKSYVYEAQLRTLRAMYNFILVTFYRNPYFSNEYRLAEDAMANYGNSDPEYFWDQIDYDLAWATDPAHNLPARQSDWGSADKGRMTTGAAWALWGKVRLWKHYYYYLENDNTDTYTGKLEYSYKYGSGNNEPIIGPISREENLKKAKECFKKVIDMGYALQGENDAETKQDFLNALLSNTTYVSELEGFGGKSYKGENNDESVWEVQFGGIDKGVLIWLPGWMSPGALNYQYFGACGDIGGYRNFEMDPEAYWTFEVPEGNTKAETAGFDRDPRAYATMYFDEAPDHPSDFIDYRPGTIFYRNFNSGKDTKRIVIDPTFSLYKGSMPFATKGIGIKKYNYPQFGAEATLGTMPGAKPPGCDPYNIRLIRFADVLLMYAEACFLSGETGGEGLAALNRVRERAGMQLRSALDEVTIIKERDYELMGEYFRFLDIVRWARDINWYSKINFSQNNSPGYGFKENFEKYTTPDPNIPYRNMYFAIPLDEINKNGGKLVQNPGW